MKNAELFHKTISILVKAYQNETLTHSSPCACAVGNLICAANNINLIPNLDELNSWRKYVWERDSPNWYWGLIRRIDENYYNKGLEQIANTGYSVSEITKIERAFESVCDRPYTYIDEDGFLGLMAVVDALMIIHEANEEEVKEAKSLFVK